MAGVITNDGTATGIKFIDDSGDYTVPQINVIVGINKVLAVQNGLMFKRDIVVECRSSNARDRLMAALMDPDGVVINGEQYVVSSVSMVESFGIGDTSIEPVWTYRLELVMA